MGTLFNNTGASRKSSWALGPVTLWHFRARTPPGDVENICKLSCLVLARWYAKASVSGGPIVLSMCINARFHGTLSRIAKFPFSSKTRQVPVQGSIQRKTTLSRRTRRSGSCSQSYYALITKYMPPKASLCLKHNLNNSFSALGLKSGRSNRHTHPSLSMFAWRYDCVSLDADRLVVNLIVFVTRRMVIVR